MRRKLKYIIMISIIVFTLGLYTNSYARITTNDPTVNSGEEVTIIINSQEGVSGGAIDITSNSGLTFKSASGGTVNGTLVAFASSENKTSGIATYKFIAPEVTENKTFKVVFSSKDMNNQDGGTVPNSTATATVTVKAKQTQTPTTPETPTTPTVTEPKFTDANKSVYATGDINLRSSWSTSSSATGIKKGTELTLTGTSKEKVNGYVWYRVKYNGATKYVASNLVTTTKPEEKKSSNTNLKSLTITNQTLLPEFNSSTTEYSLNVGLDINELEIKAETEDSNSTVTIDGNKDLKVGKNTITITVKAQDETTKKYTITVTKAEETSLGLKSLTIKEVEDFVDKFKTDVYEYEIEVGDVKLLEIEAIANKENAKIEIVGNTDLQEGENTITIIVKSEDEKDIATYQIKVNKVLKAVSNVEDNTIDKQKLLLYGITAIFGIIILIIVIAYVIKNRKKEEYEYEDNIDELPGELPEKKITYEEENSNNNEEIKDKDSNKLDGEETKEVVEQNDEIENNMINEENINNDRKSKIDYFLDNNDAEDEKPKKGKGKHSK